ncbi:MAG: WD40/YVTN/BNR-like repeat-containing protein [bacterium]
MKKSIGLLSLILAGTLLADAHRDRSSWKKTLHDKALLHEKIMQERHNIEGTCPSSVRLIPPRHYTGDQTGAWKRLVETGELPPGWIFDHGTTGLSNIAHTSSWTGCYLTAEAFRVAFWRKDKGESSPEFLEAYARADEVISGIRKLTLVSGQPGYLARGIAYGHGLSYEERGGADTRDLWEQGKGEFSDYRYRGGPSHHNYDQVFRGLGIYYFLAADESQKQAIREIVTDMSNWIHIQHDMRVMFPDGQRESTVLIGGWGGLGGQDRPSDGSVYAICGLKVAYLITGNDKLKTLHDTWVERLGFLDPEKSKENIVGGERENFDDTDHLLGDLYLLHLIEEDPALRAYYRKLVEDSWKVHKSDKNPWFNYVYQAVLGDAYGDREGSLWYLQTVPTCLIFQPRMNSIRTDLEFTDGGRDQEALRPLPGYERPSDNEYEWKGSPYQLDGWLSRIASVVEISPHDPYVQFAADTAGYAYWSNTRGEIWHAMPGLPKVNDFLFSPDYPWIALAATSGGIYRTMNGGQNWEQVSAQSAQRLLVDPENTHVIYAVGAEGIYKSPDRGERDLGTSWRVVGQGSGAPAVFAADPRGETTRHYMQTVQEFYSKSEDEPEWRVVERITRRGGFGEANPLAGRPLWLMVDEGASRRIFRAIQSSEGPSGPLITFSEDGGKTWIPVLRELKPLMDWALSGYQGGDFKQEEMRRLFGLSRRFPIQELKVDRRNPDTWYGRMETGIAVTRDAGKTWDASNKGLDIPRVQSLWMPRHADEVYVGTPAGLYVSHDRGATWSDTTLILQEEGAIRSEIGGIGYLTAYWMGRYHGYITESQALDHWWEK